MTYNGIIDLESTQAQEEGGCVMDTDVDTWGEGWCCWPPIPGPQAGPPTWSNRNYLCTFLNPVKRYVIDMVLRVNFVADMFESNPGNLFLSHFPCTW